MKQHRYSDYTIPSVSYTMSKQAPMTEEQRQMIINQCIQQMREWAVQDCLRIKEMTSE